MNRFFLLATLLLLGSLGAVGIVRANDFKGFPCTNDCESYMAGYMWAGKNIEPIMERPALCNKVGESHQFMVGCMYWFAERHTNLCYRMETLIAGGKTEDIYDLYEEFCL